MIITLTVENLIKWKPYLLVGLSINYILFYFFGFELLKISLACIAFITCVICIMDSSRFIRFFSVGMLVLGVIFTFLFHKGPYSLVSGITMNTVIITLLVLVPMLSIVFKLKGYMNSLQHYFENIKTLKRKFFSLIITSCAAIGPVLNLGAIKILHEQIADLKVDRTIPIYSFLIGFFTVALWSPYLSSVIFVLTFVDISISDYIVLAFPLAVIQLVVAILIVRNLYDKSGSLKNERKLEREHLYNIFKMIGMIVFLIVTVVAIELITHLSPIIIVSLVTVLFTFGVASFSKKRQEVKEHFSFYWTNSVGKMNNEVAVFLSAGFLSYSLIDTPILYKLNEVFVRISSFSLILLLITVIGIIVLSSALGVHPLIVAIPIAVGVVPADVGLEPAPFALMLMIGWAMTCLVSPTNGAIVLVSQLINKPPFQLIKYTGKLAIVFIAVGVAYIVFVMKIL